MRKTLLQPEKAQELARTDLVQEICLLPLED